MTLITFQDGKPVLRDGKVATEQACCCGSCFTVTAYHVGQCFGFGYNACACCGDYGLDADAVYAALESYITGAFADAFASRGFTIGGHYTFPPPTPVPATFFRNQDGTSCNPPDVECEALIGTGPLLAELCLHCDGVIVIDNTLEPLPIEEFNANATFSEACSCGTNYAVPSDFQGGESLRCVPCGGACDEENPCPSADPENPSVVFGDYACICVDGECQRVFVENQFP